MDWSRKQAWSREQLPKFELELSFAGSCSTCCLQVPAHGCHTQDVTPEGWVPFLSFPFAPQWRCTSYSSVDALSIKD